MKRWLVWVLILVCILCGCTDQPAETTPTTEPTQPKVTQPPHSILWSGSAAETAANGAVKLYAPDTGSISGLVFLDGDPVVLSVQEDATYLTRFERNTGNVKASSQLSGILYPSLGVVAAKESRLVCFDNAESVFRILDGNFKELDRIKMKDALTGFPIISQDLTTAYYTVDQEIRAINLQTGISRIVSQLNTESVYLLNLLFDDSVLCCVVADEAYSCATFLNTQNGVTLGTDETLMTIQSSGDSYLATRLDATTLEVLTGQRGETVNRFTPDGEGQPRLLSMGILELSNSENGSALGLYAAQDGKRIAQLQLTGISNITDIVEDPSGRYIWIIAHDQQNEQSILCRWDFAESGGADETVRIGTRFTADNPDTQGLARCAQLAQQIGQKYGVEIRIGTEVVTPVAYTFTYEYQTGALEKALEDLDRAMAKFPEGFFKTAARVTNDRVLHIGLIRNMQENVLNSQVRDDGLQYWIDGNAYIALCVGDHVEGDFYNELSHALDTYVYSYSIHYDFWNDCNPEGFVYDESYDLYQTHAGSPYLQDETRAFIDAYSMTFSHEDRAKVMEYAMMDGNESYFESEIMQAKLRQLCLGLRQAFGWKKYEGTFIWEQYLKESLAYVPEKK